MKAKRGWHDLCDNCWVAANPGAYLPDEPRDYAICEGCGDNTLVYGHRGPFTLTPPPQDRDGMTEPEALS